MNINLQPNITGTNVKLVRGAIQSDLTNAVNNSRTYRDESEAFSIVSENKSIVATDSANSAYSSATTASNAANTATTKANEANSSAISASASETVCIDKTIIATDKADISTSQAVIATNKAIEANNDADTATTQAGIAITKASEASTSASNALVSANNADTSEANALTYRNEAEAFANSVNPSNIVHITGTETITGDKTFSGIVSGLTKATVGLGNVTNESKATMFTSPTFTGTVTLPSTTSIGTISNTELGYLDGVTSAIQTQINSKANNSDVVNITDNQTVAGIKTFTSSPIVPTPTTDFQSVPLKSTNITVNVGSGEQFTTINQALEYLSGFYPMYKKSGVTATINLKAGFVMAEQVLVSGIDLGWITIVGEDAETIITHTALTTSFNGHYPAFGVDKGGTSPVIGQLFRFNVEKAGGSKHGLMTFGAGSSANVLSGKGFIGAGGNGIHASNGSTINAQGANCSNAGGNGIYAVAGSTINANGANCSNAAAHGIAANEASTINAISTTVQNQTAGIARVRVLNGSYIEASYIITTGGTVAVFNQAVNTLTSQGIIYG